MKRRNVLVILAFVLGICGVTAGCSDDSSSSGKKEEAGCQCSDTQKCIDNVCYNLSDLCGDVKCKSDEKCSDNICVPIKEDPAQDLCGDVKCKSDEVCRDNKCVLQSELCGDILCNADQTCLNSKCIDNNSLCGTSVCNDLQVCNNDECISKDKICGESVCLEAESCREGSCVSTELICGSLLCESSQSCINSECIESDLICGAEICTTDQICQSGQCFDKDKICGDYVCSSVQVCLEGSCVAEESLCGGIVCEGSQICVDSKCQEPTPAEILLDLGSSPVVSENGTKVVVKVSLATKPEADVNITITSSDEGEVAVDLASMTFTPDNWNVPQSVDLIGVDDDIIDGSVEATITFAAVSEDAEYNIQSTKVITNEDNDKAALIVNSTGTSLAEGSTESAEFSVVLSAQPAANVVVQLTSTDSTAIIIDGESTITFTPDNWYLPQPITVKPVDDELADGTQSATIVLSSTSEDSNFNMLSGETEAYLVTDNESAGVVLAASATTLKADSNSADISVSLTVAPTSDVTVTLATTNDITASLSETTLTFTTANWNTPQTVKVETTDFMAALKALTEETISATASSIGAYNGIKGNDINLKIYAFTSLDIEKPRTCEMLFVELLPGKYKLEVWGGQGGSDGPGGGKAGQSGGKGGYAAGNITLTTKQKVYYMIGEYSLDFNNHPGATPCNGGGVNSGSSTGAGGGGATHMAATELGALSNYESSLSDVYIVAGGGGGAGDYAAGGSGGGESGGQGVGSNSGAGGTQTIGYKFGAGEPASGQNPGGGGGWYGGKRSNGGVQAGGGGGSGYIGGVSDGVMEAGVQTGDGKARITLLDE